MTPTIQGNLAGQPLTELLQYLHALRKKGQLVIERGDPPASAAVYVANGRVIHACCPPLEGIDAVFAILPWRDGRFVFLDGASPERETVAADLHSLLLEGARRADELQRLYTHLPPFTSVLFPEYDGQVAPDATLTRRQWRMWERTNGLRTVAELIRMSGPDELDAASDLAALVEHSLVRTAPREAFLAAIVPESLVSIEDVTEEDLLSQIDLTLLGLMDGRRSLADLALATGADGSVIARSCRTLVDADLVRLVAGLSEYHRYLH